MLSFFPRGVLDEILNLIESVAEDFPSYSFMFLLVERPPVQTRDCPSRIRKTKYFGYTERRYRQKGMLRNMVIYMESCSLSEVVDCFKLQKKKNIIKQCVILIQLKYKYYKVCD